MNVIRRGVKMWLIRCTVNVICLTGKMIEGSVEKRECEGEK